MTKRFEYEGWACPLFKVEGEWDADGNGQTFWLVPCGEQLHLSRATSHEVSEPLDGAGFVTNWRVECEWGHRLLDGAYGDEDDAPYDPAWRGLSL